MPRKEDLQIVEMILNRFKLDKVCPKCGGPIERNSITSCNNCKNMIRLKVAIDTIETTTMGLRFDLVKTPKPKTAKPKKKPVKKSTKGKAKSKK